MASAGLRRPPRADGQLFFPPAALPINPNLDRGQVDKWLEIFGRGNAAAFDRHGWQYYVRDVFDLFYPGYWDSWSSLNGATGMTYETDGGGWKGLNWRRDDESILTLREGIARHFTASLATLQTAAAHRVERLRDYRAFFVRTIAEGRQGLCSASCFRLKVMKGVASGWCRFSFTKA